MSDTTEPTEYEIRQAETKARDAERKRTDGIRRIKNETELDEAAAEALYDEHDGDAYAAIAKFILEYQRAAFKEQGVQTVLVVGRPHVDEASPVFIRQPITELHARIQMANSSGETHVMCTEVADGGTITLIPISMILSAKGLDMDQDGHVKAVATALHQIS